MWFNKHKYRSRPGGASRHYLWPVELTLFWDTDRQFKYLPAAFQCLVFAVIAEWAAIAAAMSIGLPK